MDRIKILKALAADAKKLTQLALRSKAYWKYSKEQLESWKEELTVTKEYLQVHHVFKAVKNDIIVGFYTFKNLDPQNIKLDFFFVDPKYINQGFGKILMLDFLDRINTSKHKRVTVLSDPNAQKFYSKFGFRVTKTVESSIKNRFLPIMEKKLKTVNQTP